MANLIEVIEQEIQSYQEDRDKQSAILERHYHLADKSGKDHIDNVLLCLCGWSYKTLKDMAVKGTYKTLKDMAVKGTVIDKVDNNG